METDTEKINRLEKENKSLREWKDKALCDISQPILDLYYGFKTLDELSKEMD